MEYLVVQQDVVIILQGLFHRIVEVGVSHPRAVQAGKEVRN